MHLTFFIRPSALAGVALAAATSATAADATFTPDNKKVIQIEPEERHTLVEIDPATGASRKLFEAAAVEFRAVALDRHDHYILADEKSLWVWKPGEAKPAKLASVKPSIEGWEPKVVDIAADPSSDRIVVTCSETKGDDEHTPAWIYDTGKKEWGKIRCRYVRGIETPCFNTRGELCFSVHGDLWHGIIEEDVPWTLVAYRYAAVATLYTYNGSPTQSGVEQLAVSGDQLIINHHRMGGSGWGTLYSLPGPAKKFDDSGDGRDLKEQLATARKIGSSLKELGDGDGVVVFGSSRDGSTAWVMWPMSQSGLLISGGKTTPVKLR